MLVDRRGIEFDRANEEESSVCGEIVEALRARLQQLEDREEPRVTLAEIVVAPESGGFERGLDSARELVGREPHDVLLIEPIQFLGIEHRIPAADAIERERLHDVV